MGCHARLELLGLLSFSSYPCLSSQGLIFVRVIFLLVSGNSNFQNTKKYLANYLTLAFNSLYFRIDWSSTSLLLEGHHQKFEHAASKISGPIINVSNSRVVVLFAVYSLTSASSASFIGCTCQAPAEDICNKTYMIIYSLLSEVYL